MASTYDAMPTDQPPNQPNEEEEGTGLTQTLIADYDATPVAPTFYISVRATTPHNKWDVIEKLISDLDWYICYPHSGKEGNNEHFHCLLPGCTKNDCERIRKRFKSAGFIGNKFVGVKLCENSITSGIGYCAHEGTQPITKGDVESWIKQAPEWVENRLGRKRKATDDYVLLNVTNMLKICFEYRRQGNIKSTDMRVVMRLMMNSGKYFMSPTLIRQGAPKWFLATFEDSCASGHLNFHEKNWDHDIFRDPQVRF